MGRRIYFRAYASVRFMGEFLDPLDVTLALRLPYDHAHRTGEPRLTRHRNGNVQEHPPYRESLWSMSSEEWVDSPVLDTHVRWLLDQLEQRRDGVIRILESGVRADILCYSVGHSPDPPSLPKETLGRAEAMGIRIGIDHYESDESSSEQNV